MARFELSYALTREFEGGFANHPEDPGGRTMLGIAERWHPDLWRGNTPPDEAACMERFRVAYWDALRLNGLVSQRLANEVFDFAVTSGPSDAAKALQRAYNALRRARDDTLTVDGIVGPLTLAAVNLSCRHYPGVVWRTFCVYRGQHYLRLRNATFVRGWMRRVFSGQHTGGE